jgi:serine/threonine protein kinase
MALVGRGLDKLIEDRPNRKFSPGTAVGVSIQLINALRALHGIGFLHRDIKPANSTIGRPEDGELRVVYLLDFGMARKFTREDVSSELNQQLQFQSSLHYLAGNAAPPTPRIKLSWITALRSHLRSHQP